MYARRRIEPGHVLEAGDVASVRVLPEFVDRGRTLSTVEEVVGRTAREVLLPGEPLRLERLTGQGVGAGAQAWAPQGTRAVEVPAEHALIRPGDRVDLVWRPRDGAPCTLAQLALVLEAPPGALTVALAPPEADRVAAALARGEGFLPALRNPADFDPGGVASCEARP